MREKRKSNLRLFRISLHVDFDNVDIRDRQHLKELMQYKGYHLTGTGLETLSPPTDKQMEIAWSEMSSKFETVKPEFRYIWVSAYSYTRNKKKRYVKKYKRRVKNV